MNELERSKLMAKARRRLNKESNTTHEQVAQEEAQEFQLAESTQQRADKTASKMKGLFPRSMKKNETMESLKNFVSGVGTAVDYFAAAPTREGIMGLAKGEGFVDKVKQGVGGFFNQYTRGPSEAATGSDIADELGLSKEDQPVGRGGEIPSWLPQNPNEAAGLAIDVLGDFSNVVPVTKAVSLVGKGLGMAGKNIAKYGAKGVDVVTGTKTATKIGKGVQEGTIELGSGVKHMFDGKPVKDWDNMEDIAKRNNIDSENLPAAVKYGKSSYKSYAERVKGEGPSGEALRVRHEDRVVDVNNAVSKEVQAIAGGRPLDNVQSGAMLKTKFDEHVNKVFDEVGARYDDVTAGNPNLLIENNALNKMDNTINSIKRSAERDFKKGASNVIRNQGKQILRNIEMIQKSGGSYKETLESLRDIGKEAFSSTNPAMVGPSKKEMQKLYFAMRDALTETADKVNPNLGRNLRENNRILSELIGEKSTIGKIIQNPNLADENILKSVLNNTKSIKALKRFYSPEEMKSLKGTFLNTMIKKNLNEGSINFKGIFNKLENKRDLAKELFEVDELKNFEDLLGFGDRLGIPVMSTSGTGTSNIFSQLIKEPIQRAANVAVEKVASPTLKKVKSKKRKLVEKAGLKGSQVYSVQRNNEEK